MRFLLILCAATLAAQTSVKPEQIRTAPAPAVRLLAFDSTGRLMLLDLGPGLQIVGSTITATPADSPAPVLVSTRLARDANGSYPAIVGIVTRNGVVQEAGKDFTVSGGLLTPVEKWTADDVVLGITAQKSTLPAVLRIAP
jgi:hypothetical protein